MVRDIRGRIQLTVRFDDGQRSSTVTSLPWAGSSQADLINLAERIKPMVTAGKTVKEAVELVDETPTTSAGATDWQAVAEAFQQHKLNSGAVSERTWHRNYRLRIQRAVDLLNGKPRPTGGSALLKALVEKHFPGGKGAGGTDRRTSIQYVAQLLTFAVAECGADQRWAPPLDLKDLVGVRSKAKAATTPIKDDQLVRLMPAITNPAWRLAIGLTACFGLRGAELAHLSVNGDLLHCDYRKRTAKRPEGTQPRDIVGLDPVGLEGLSAHLLSILKEHGNDALPPGCRGPRAGDALHQYLERHRAWIRLVAETAETPRGDGGGQDLVPYGLRHGYALRAHEVYGITPRRAAALMGHSLQTHSSTYGTWTDREMVEGTLADVQNQVARRKLEAMV